jgi:hypothetical protein
VLKNKKGCTGERNVTKRHTSDKKEEKHKAQGIKKSEHDGIGIEETEEVTPLLSRGRHGRKQ